MVLSMSMLDLSAESYPDASVLRLSGEADFGTVDELRAALAACVEDETGSVVVDLTALDFLDSTVVALLLRLRQRLASEERRLTVVARSSRARQMLEMTGTAQSLHVVG
jgi:anti-anti-sigma factor